MHIFTGADYLILKSEPLKAGEVMQTPVLCFGAVPHKTASSTCTPWASDLHMTMENQPHSDAEEPAGAVTSPIYLQKNLFRRSPGEFRRRKALPSTGL